MRGRGVLLVDFILGEWGFGVWLDERPGCRNCGVEERGGRGGGRVGRREGYSLQYSTEYETQPPESCFWDCCWKTCSGLSLRNVASW